MSESLHILLVDDDATFRKVTAVELSRRGYSVAMAASGEEALDPETIGHAEVILLDLRLPDMDGIEVLRRLRERNQTARVIVLTGHGTIDTAIRATRLGAYDYLTKPCPIDEMDMAIRKAHEHKRLVERQSVLEDGYSPADVEQQFVGASSALAKVRRTIARIAPTGSSVLVLGETGVGKGMAAKLIHAYSLRRSKPFVVVDCASLQDTLLLSELFGHEKGAFTGAARKKHGLFQVARGGTLFLDEIGELSPEGQAKLLGVLETGRFRRIGGTAEIVADVRVVSATNRNLREAISRRLFREDLFFRLAILTVEIPPLRERRDDIRAFVEHFVQRFNVRFSLERRVGPKAMEALLRYSWPGNVREVIHAIEQAVVLSEHDELRPEDFPSYLRVSEETSGTEAPVGEPLSLREVQRRHVLAVLERAGGVRAQAARVLEISERNLYRMLKKYEQ